jgi:hypothetical protein
MHGTMYMQHSIYKEDCSLQYNDHLTKGRRFWFAHVLVNVQYRYNTVLYSHNHNHNLCYRVVIYTTQTCDMFPWVFCLHIVLHKNKNDLEVNLQHHWVPGHFQWLKWLKYEIDHCPPSNATDTN